MELLANILISAMIAATPLVFAATGELVAERRVCSTSAPKA